MHYLLVNAYVAQARKRVSEGDCQTIAPLHPDNVDDVIVALAARAEAAEAERRAYEIFANSEIATLKAENARLREALQDAGDVLRGAASRAYAALQNIDAALGGKT